MNTKLLLSGLVVVFLAVCGPVGAVKAGNTTVEEQVVQSACGKQVVLLGELPSHGEGRAFEAKAAIVRQLVERCGFNAVLFEAPIYEFLGFEQAVADRRADPAQLDRAIGGFWTTAELSAWRRWLFEQARGGRLHVGGIDDQVSATSEYTRATLPGLVARFAPAGLASACKESLERNLFWRYDAEHALDPEEQARLASCTAQAAQSVAARVGDNNDAVTRIMLENIAELYRRQAEAAGPLDRDAAMDRNVRWHRDRLRATGTTDVKIVVWTATVHAARLPGARGLPLGASLANRLGDGLASIGFTAFGGQSSMAGRPVRPIPEATPGSLEALATAAGQDGVHPPRAYLDAAALRDLGAVSSRLLGAFATDDWSRYFDGVVVIREEVAPTFNSGGDEAQWAVHFRGI